MHVNVISHCPLLFSFYKLCCNIRRLLKLQKVMFNIRGVDIDVSESFYSFFCPIIIFKILCASWEFVSEDPPKVKMITGSPVTTKPFNGIIKRHKK